MSAWIAFDFVAPAFAPSRASCSFVTIVRASSTASRIFSERSTCSCKSARVTPDAATRGSMRTSRGLDWVHSPTERRTW